VSAAALANLDVMERDGLLERARELEGALATALGPLADRAVVSEVRAGTGVLAAVQIDPEALASDPSLLGRVVPACRRNAIMTRTLATGAIQVSPPLSLSDDEVDELASGLASAIDELEA
jgi:adenosylmethionine-8-amino-7-oxononanoate aminotransferase